MTRGGLQEELKKIHADLLHLEGLAETMLGEAIMALKQRDAALAVRVIESDDRVDQLAKNLEEDIVKMIALYQPVASDLRRMVGAIHNTIDLERVADLAVDIAELVPDLAKQPLLKPLIDIPRMTEIAQIMLHDSLDALRDGDVDKARNVCLRDQEVDELFMQIVRELIGFMIQDPITVNRAVPLLFVARALERIGDHATNVAEMVFYQATGNRVTCKSIEEAARKTNES